MVDVKGDLAFALIGVLLLCEINCDPCRLLLLPAI